MPRLIEGPTSVEAAGTPPKTIREHVGVVNTGEGRLSIAHMTSPPGWSEPWQRPDFDEWTVVLAGAVRVEYDGGAFVVSAGQAVHAAAGERVRYSTPDGADYVAVCLPAFTPDSVHRDP
jgi:quercetin dioxygenase-like cupin family protein